MSFLARGCRYRGRGSRCWRPGGHRDLEVDPVFEVVVHVELGKVVLPAVDVDRRRSRDRDQIALLAIAADAIGRSFRLPVSLPLGKIEADLFGVLLDVAPLERLLVLDTV